MKTTLAEKNTYIQSVKRFSELTALIIGDVMIDSYLWGKTDRISPEAPVPVVDVSHRENRMGGAANVAMNVQKLGAKPILCTVIGADEMALIYNDLLEEEGLEALGVINSSKRKTTQKTRIISENQQLLRVDEETISPLEPEDEIRLIEKTEECIVRLKPDVIIFEDYNKGICTPKIIHEVQALALKHQIPTSVDPKKANFFEYKNATLFKPNLKEFIEGLKLSSTPETHEQWIQNIHDLRQQINHTYTLVTLSEKGVLIESKDDFTILPAHVRNIADVSGAGDTVISVASLCLALKINPKAMADLANLAGGLVCEKVGVVPITQEQLISEIQNS